MADQKVAHIFPDGTADEQVEISTHGNFVELDTTNFGEMVSLMLTPSVARRVAYSLLAAAEIILSGCRYVPTEPPCTMVVVEIDSTLTTQVLHVMPCPVKK